MESICFNKIGEIVPCGLDFISSNEINETIADYCGELGQHCTDREYDEVFKAATKGW